MLFMIVAKITLQKAERLSPVGRARLAAVMRLTGLYFLEV